MRLIELKCPNCNSTMQVDDETKEVVCDFCGAKFAVDDEAQHILYDNAEQAGYEFEKGRQKAQAEQYQNMQANQQAYVQQKKRKTWLWVLGWIFIFPVPLTIIMVNKKEMNKWLRIGIIAAAWIIYLILGFAGGSSDTSSTEHNNGTITEPSSAIEQQEASFDGENAIESFVKSLNSKLGSDIAFVEDFEVQDNSSSHYKVEFRLGAYKEAIGKAYKYGNVNIDIIARKDLSNEAVIRLYANNASLDECNELIKASANIFDPNLTETDINEITGYMLENKSANGYYKGNIGISLLGSDNMGYELMIKNGND